MKGYYETIMEFTKFSKLMKVFLFSLAKQINEREVMNIQRAFNTINKSQSGELSLMEFLEGNSLFHLIFF